MKLNKKRKYPEKTEGLLDTVMRGELENDRNKLLNEAEHDTNK